MSNTADTQSAYEAPDSLPEPDEESEIEIEVLDDTPAEDVRAARPAADRVDPDSEEFEQEIQDYSDNAQKRIKAVKFEYHEERRAKETALRQSEEAIRYAEQVARDNANLKQSLQDSNSVLVEQYGARTDAELEKARADFKDAYEGGETDALLEAQEKLAKLHAERVGTLRQAPAAVQPVAEQPYQPQVQQNNAPDVRATQWLRENQWFQQKGSEDMTGYAIGLHQKLVASGLNPQIHEEYYSKIDQGMRSVFPDRFSSADLASREENSPVVTHTKKKPPQVGGPSRGGVPPRKVQLTGTQVALAKRLGLSNKQYAAQVAKEQLNG
jgi:hypothetical protein|tara:strand:- start:1326 stop:2303 length:978 start_codon:yes stop_codon:yes gene_type:complete